MLFVAIPLVALRFLLAGIPVRPTAGPGHGAAKRALREALDVAEPAGAIAAVVRHHAVPKEAPRADALTAKEVGALLRANQAGEAVALRVERLLVACERHQYAGERNIDAERALAREALGCIHDLERQKNRENRP
jgi:hypothetical protein